MAQVEYQKVEAGGALGRSAFFEEGQQPQLAESKGSWKRRVDSLPVHPLSYYTVSEEIGATIGIVYTLKSVASLKAIRLAELAAKRFAVETAGVTVGGVAIKTDRESQGLVDSLQRSLADEIVATVKFKTAAGAIVDADLATASAIRAAVVAHVQASRENEAAHAEAIEALETSAEVAAYDINTDW